MSEALCETHLPGKEPVSRGKVRDIYDLGEKLLIVATDRISAFDWVNPVGIPEKGKILTQMSLYWFGVTRDICRNHLVSSSLQDFPEEALINNNLLPGIFKPVSVEKCSGLLKTLSVEKKIRRYLPFLRIIYPGMAG